MSPVPYPMVSCPSVGLQSWRVTFGGEHAGTEPGGSRVCPAGAESAQIGDAVVRGLAGVDVSFAAVDVQVVDMTFVSTARSRRKPIDWTLRAVLTAASLATVVP